MIIGREKQLARLERAYRSKKSQFITIYGRRRVGKTYLIKEFFKPKNCYFMHVTGIQQGKLKDQLEKFTEAVSDAFLGGARLETPRNWKEAFRLLNNEIKRTEGKVVIFFDELPWLATQKSGLMNQLDYYWNNKWAWMERIIFVACGSSASWILKNIMYNTGGFHNRTTLEIQLLPFKLRETREFLESNGVKLNDRQVLSIYMALGGIPYYLAYIIPGLTAQQNIQGLFFDEDAPLRNEYRKLFDSLFDGAEAYAEIMELLAGNRGGLTRSELQKKAKLSSKGGYLSKRLADLRDTGFIKEYTPWGKVRGAYYQITDEFCLFYLRWVKGSEEDDFDSDHWIIQSQRPVYYSWAGYAYEAVCAKHRHHITRALGIKTATTFSSWRYVPHDNSERGAQIDLVIDRIDNAITLCEIKYTDKPYVIDKKSAEGLNRKIDIFKKQTKTTKQIFLAMVSASGLKETIYSEEMVSGVVTLEDLFKQYG